MHCELGTCVADAEYSGIGLETTILFLREGASVLMTDVSEAALAKAVNVAKQKVSHMAGKLVTKGCDVSKEADVQAAVETLDPWGGLDVMVNNAGIMHGQDDGECLMNQAGGVEAVECVLISAVQMPSTHQKISGI